MTAPVVARWLFAPVFCLAVWGQTEPSYLTSILKQEILPANVAHFQLQTYIVKQVRRPSVPASAEAWTKDAAKLRQQLLNDVVFRGWPKEWVDASPKFEELAVTRENGYQMRKLRYEIVPGFQSVAILYEPLNVTGKVPAILNTNGHVGPPGKSVEYKQKRCITFARNGVVALNLEWLSFGELGHKWNDHSFGAHLDLVGVNELGLFYLAMRKGLDYLYNHPQVDRDRIGMTGLSGGGWQTIVLSSLDERVRAAVPVAGFSSIVPRVEDKDHGDVGDFEQSTTDFLEGRDYPHLVALMAPRPTLLAYNAEDDCCFRAALAKPHVYDGIRPFFALYGKENNFAWHENLDPGTHNYQLDNRKAAYDFFKRHFKLPKMEEDPNVSADIKSYQDLVVGLPENNLTILGLARQFADRLERTRASLSDDAERKRLREIVRYQPTKMDRLGTTAITRHLGVESKSHLFTMSEGLSSTGVWMKAIDSPLSSPVTIVLNDKGKGESSVAVAERVNRANQVLALDLPFTGDSWSTRGTWAYLQMIYTSGARPLGIEVAHLVAIANWLKQRAGLEKVRLESHGMRSQVIALLAATIEPSLFSGVVSTDGIRSLRHLLDKPVPLPEAPDLFCFDLLKFTDIDRLEKLAGAPAPASTRPIKNH